MAGHKATYETVEGETIELGRRILNALHLIVTEGLTVHEAAAQARCTWQKLAATCKSPEGVKVLEDMLQSREIVTLARARAFREELMARADNDSARLKAIDSAEDRIKGKATTRVEVETKAQPAFFLVKLERPKAEPMQHVGGARISRGDKGSGRVTNQVVDGTAEPGDDGETP